MMDYAAIFASLAQSWAAYQSRPEQIQLAEGIAEALQQQSILIAEAGTGIGKTYAYLLPALLEHKKVVVATANKNLQEQIFIKDLPALAEALGEKPHAVLLKGRQSYFCHQRYQDYCAQRELVPSEKRYLERIERFLRHSEDGDLADLRGVPEGAPIMSHLHCSSEQCLRSHCPFFDRCFVYRAKERAESSDILIINHHLLGVYFKLSALGLATPLQGREALIIDEAHQLPEALRDAFGAECSSRRLFLYYNFCQNQLPYLQAPHYIVTLQQLMERLRHIEYETDLKQEALLQEQDLWQLLEELQALLTQWCLDENNEDLQAMNASRSGAARPPQEDLQAQEASLRGAASQTRSATHSILKDAASQTRGAPHQVPNEEALQAARLLWRQRSSALMDDLATLLRLARQPEQQDEALWLRAQQDGFTLHSMPVDVRQAELWQERAAIFLSATLALNGNGDYFAQSLGLSAYRFLQFDSPFDYRKQALLYHPRGLPDPRQADYTKQMMARMEPVLAYSQGRALLLFTSYRALKEAAQCLENSDFNVLIQGEDSKNELLKRFRREPRSVLLATQSFWEGVDIRGRDLVCVMIDKLPFSVPDDPVKALREKRLGKHYFQSEYLPQMLMRLKQGVGRLIRDHRDYGVLVLCDPRLNHPSYGHQVLNSLPRMSRCDDVAVVKRFFQHHEPEETS